MFDNKIDWVIAHLLRIPVPAGRKAR
jgi:hypothetical protein